MKKSELMEVIEILKEYNLIGCFNSVDEAEKWLLTLDSKKIENIKILHKNDKIYFSPLRRVLLNGNLLSSEFYKKILDIFVSLDNFDNLDQKLNELCNKVSIGVKFINDLNLIKSMGNVELGIDTLMNDNFINSPYHDDDLLMIFASDKELEEPLCKIATSKESINGLYHVTDMEKVIDSEKINTAEWLASLATNEVSLASNTHEKDMDLLENCSRQLKSYLFDLMTTKSLVGNPNYELERKSVMHSFSPEKACAKLYLITRRNSIERNRLEYLLISIDSLPNDVITLYADLLLTDEFFNSPYLEDDIEILKEADTRTKFIMLCNLMLDKNSIESEHHVEDVRCILKETDRKKINLLIKVAKNHDNLHSITHRFDMNFIDRIDLDDISSDDYNIILYYLFDPKGINAFEHVDVLQKISMGMKIKSSVEEYFEKLENDIKTSNDGEDINILKRK